MDLLADRPSASGRLTDAAASLTASREDAIEAEGQGEGQGASQALSIVLIEPRRLTRDCIAHALRSLRRQWTVADYPSLQAWVESGTTSAAAQTAEVVLLSTAGRSLADDVRAGIARAKAVARGAGVPLPTLPPFDVPVVLLSDSEDGDGVLAALEGGARGYIPANSSLGVAIEAIRLVRAGGTYVPASCLLTWGRAVNNPGVGDKRHGGFSARQAAVLKALREGKANKTIAYELNMQESTVKVHVRNIMKKVNARNRTEVAYKTKDIFAAADRTSF